MNNELDNLTTINTNSGRKGGQLFDLHLDGENNQFTVSKAFYATNDMNNHGFIAHYNPDNGQVYLSVRPNEEAVSYKGKEGFEKGESFRSTTMSDLMERVDLSGNLSLTEVGSKDGFTYYRVESAEETIDEELTGEPMDSAEDSSDDELENEPQTEEELV